MKYFEDLDLTR